MFWAYTVLISCIKALLIPAYRSTDFEVHRNWLAITHNKSINQWYFEETSEWTLDYPPLFAWFEFILSQFAQFFDADMLKVENLNYASENTVLFQRMSVIITDIVYFYGVYLCITILGKGKRSEIILPILMLANPGLLMVDHVHFQYNGIMYGILLISICKIMQRKVLQGAFWFTILLCMKHIYVYIAPAYFIYLLTTYCLTIKSKPSAINNKPSKEKAKVKDNGKNGNETEESMVIKLNFINCLKLGAIVVGIAVITFLPFIGHIDQVLSRLFPFKRGLCHAYWAPNFWALYNLGDKAAMIVVSKMGLNLNMEKASMTGGLVKEYSHNVLPNISPKMTILLVAITMMPAIVKLAKSTHKPNNFIRCIVLCALSSFMFGWHVHEKAILMAIIPLCILAVVEPGDTKVYLLLSTVGHFSLFPLLFPPNLLFIKLTLVILHSAYAFYSLHNLHPFQFCQFTLPMLNSVESMYTLGLLPVFLYCEILHGFIPVINGYQFLPLMITSVYCALGVTYSYVKYYVYFLMKCK